MLLKFRLEFELVALAAWARVCLGRSLLELGFGFERASASAPSIGSTTSMMILLEMYVYPCVYDLKLIVKKREVWPSDYIHTSTCTYVRDFDVSSLRRHPL
jgi:hypothetical protein